MNTLDYIYKSMDCQIVLLEKMSLECQYLLRYISTSWKGRYTTIINLTSMASSLQIFYIKAKWRPSLKSRVRLMKRNSNMAISPQIESFFSMAATSATLSASWPGDFLYLLLECISLGTSLEMLVSLSVLHFVFRWMSFFSQLNS